MPQLTCLLSPRYGHYSRTGRPRPRRLCPFLCPRSDSLWLLDIGSLADRGEYASVIHISKLGCNACALVQRQQPARRCSWRKPGASLPGASWLHLHPPCCASLTSMHARAPGCHSDNCTTPVIPSLVPINRFLATHISMDKVQLQCRQQIHPIVVDSIVTTHPNLRRLPPNGST